MAATEAQKRYWKTPKGKAMKKAADRRYYERNAEAIRTRVNGNFHALSLEEKLERGRRNREAEGKESRRERCRVEQAKLKRDVLLGYGGACECCGNDYLPHLTIDHVNGGGTQHRKKETQVSLYRRLRREGFPRGEYRVLCWNCNWASHSLGECSCQRTEEGGDALSPQL